MNSPTAVLDWLLLPALGLLALYGLCLAVGAVCEANVARHLRAAGVELARSAELPQSVLDESPWDAELRAELVEIRELDYTFGLPAYKRNPR